jgi:hypothetical protein
MDAPGPSSFCLPPRLRRPSPPAMSVVDRQNYAWPGVIEWTKKGKKRGSAHRKVDGFLRGTRKR